MLLCQEKCSSTNFGVETFEILGFGGHHYVEIIELTIFIVP